MTTHLHDRALAAQISPHMATGTGPGWSAAVGCGGAFLPILFGRLSSMSAFAKTFAHVQAEGML